MGTPSSRDRPRAGGLAETVPASEPDEPETLPQTDKPDERYRLGTELGRGGMGRVVEAFDVQLGRTVALKEVLPKGGPGTVRRFTREVQLTARLEHPSIVPLYDAGTGPDGRPYYVMRRVTGRPLDELIGRARGLGERLTLVPAVLAAIDAVAHAHRRGVIHRDLKPANILVGELGETVVIDWGLAKVIGEDDETGDSIIAPGDSLQTQMGSVFGTPGFMAPEQARGEELSTQGDVYALGATLYHLLAGTPPHAGNSATEVIDKTSRLEVRPLSAVAPGAPPELVAIVGKALAFDPAARYTDAGALGEDVRRFLSGQLVAAHNYTSRQKLGRFARKHRGALAVAALATVAVAVLAWFAVHRIVTERDHATEARHQALIDKQAAEDARDRLAERHDALVVMQANALLEANPTEAIAILKQLSARSPRLADARAIAQAATMRGVAWAMPGPKELSVIAELSPDGKRLLQVTVDGKVRVWDLELRRLVVERPFIEQTRAAWVSGGRVLTWNKKVPPALMDPNANTSAPLAIAPITEAVVSERGDRVAFLAAAGGAGVLDLATTTTRMLPSERDVTDLDMAPDGNLIAVGSKSGLVVFDGGGKELARKLGYYPVFRISRAGAVAAISDRTVIELKLTPQPVWTDIPFGAEAPHVRPLVVVYRGDDLMIITSKFELLQWNGRVLYRRKQLESIGPMIRETGLESLTLATPTGRLDVVYPLGVASIRLPHIVKGLRLAARHDSSRLVVVGEGVVLTYDLAAVLPKQIAVPGNSDAIFVGDDKLLTITSIGAGRWQWLDLVTGKSVPIEDLEGMPVIISVDAVTGRVLVREDVPTQRGPDQHLVLLRLDRPEREVIAEAPKIWGQLIGGDTILFEMGDGRVFARTGTKDPREVIKLAGTVRGLVALGDTGFAASSSGGEVVRMDLRSGKLERARVAVGTSGFVAVEKGNRVVIVEDRRLSLWDTSIVEIATFDKPIVGIDPIAGGVVVHFDDQEAQIVELVPNATPHRLMPFAKRPPVVDAKGTLMVGLGSAQQLTILELPARARWTVPNHYETLTSVLTVSPYTRRIVQGHRDGLALWQLPSADGDLKSWLESQSNAVVDRDGVLAWPWQLPP